MVRKIWILLILAPLIVGCSSGIERASPTRQLVLSSSGEIVKKINLSFTPEAQKELADNLKFNQNTLVDTVRRALQARNLYDETSPHATKTIDIVMTNIRVRSNFNALMWGFMAGADKLNGDVVLRDDKGGDLNHFSVYADYALGGLAGAQDEARMGWLYEKFAQLTVQNLVGEVTASANGAAK